MRFSLRTLLLLFPALILSYELAYDCAVQVDIARGAEIHHTHHFETQTLVGLQLICESKFWWYEHAGLQNFFDAFLSGQKQSIPPDVLKRLAEFDGFAKDSWNNPYRCVLLNERLHFYSNGQDGISRSAGNDPDDLNSWNTLSNKFYGDQYAAE